MLHRRQRVSPAIAFDHHFVRKPRLKTHDSRSPRHPCCRRSILDLVYSPLAWACLNALKSSLKVSGEVVNPLPQDACKGNRQIRNDNFSTHRRQTWR
jgi:hypothetical protein